MNRKNSFSNNSVSNKMSRNVSSGEDMSGEDLAEEFALTSFLVTNVCDLPQIYTHICYSVYKKELTSNPERLLSIMEHLSFVNITSNDVANEFCYALKSKNINDLDEFIKSSSKNPIAARETSIFRFDPKIILSIFMNHDNGEQATYFIRYIMYSAHLPADMNSFLERYKHAEWALRDAMIPKVIY